MKKLIYMFAAIIVLIAIAVSINNCSKKSPVKEPITFESVVGSDYAYIDSVFSDTIETHFYEARAYMPTRVDSSAYYNAPIDSITSIFSVGLKIYFFNHKIVGDSVTTDTCIYNGPFVEDCEIPWPLPFTFEQMMKTVKAKKLTAPHIDVALRRALTAKPKEYADFTIFAGNGDNWWFISTKDGSVRTDQISEIWNKQYNEK